MYRLVGIFMCACVCVGGEVRVSGVCEGGADAVLAHLGGASPAGAELAVLKHFHLQADVDGEARVAAGEGELAAGSCGRGGGCGGFG